MAANVPRDLLDRIIDLERKVKELSGRTNIRPASTVVRILDANGNAVVAADTAPAGGLGMPWIAYPLPMPNTNALWPGTTSATFATIAVSRGFLHHPRLRIRVAISLGSGTSGQLQLNVNGVTVATGALNTEINTTVDVPSFAYNGTPTEVLFELQAVRTAGTGSVFGMTRYIYGVGS